MGLNALLTLDLEQGVSSEQRHRFYEKLKELNWVKIQSLTTVWYGRFTDETSKNIALNTTKSHVKQAASFAQIRIYKAAVQFGNDSHDEFSS